MTRLALVGCNNEGCIISRSQEAKDLGVPIGAPLHQQQEIIRKHGAGDIGKLGITPGV